MRALIGALLMSVLPALAGRMEIQVVSAQSSAPPLRTDCSISGAVNDAATGVGIADARVVAMLPAGQDVEVITDDSGRYVIRGLRPGTYYLAANKPGYISMRLGPVRLLAGMARELNLSLGRPSILSGRVIDLDGGPVADASVQVWTRRMQNGRPMWMFRGATQSDSGGAYAISRLNEGVYYVAVVPQHVQGQIRDAQSKNRVPSTSNVIAAYYPGTHSIELATPIRLRTSETRRGVDISVARAASYCAVAKMIAGAAKPATAELFQVSAGLRIRSGTVRVQPGQRFEFCGLSPETTYVISAISTGNSTEDRWFAASEFIGGAVDAARGQLNLGDITLRPSRTVTIKVEVVGRAPAQAPPGGFLSIQPGNNAVNDARDLLIGGAPELTLTGVVDDEYWISVVGLSSGYYLRNVGAERNDLDGEPWTPDSGDITITIAADGPTLNGRVVDKDNHPARSAYVVMVPRATDRHTSTHILSAHVDVDGAFKFASGVAPGEYRIVALNGLVDGEADDAKVVNKFLSQGVDIALPARADKSLLLTAIEVER